MLASVDVNMKKFASATHAQYDLMLKLKPLSVKVVEATLKLTLTCVFLKEGKATWVAIYLISHLSQTYRIMSSPLATKMFTVLCQVDRDWDTKWFTTLREVEKALRQLSLNKAYC